MGIPEKESVFRHMDTKMVFVKMSFAYLNMFCSAISASCTAISCTDHLFSACENNCVVANQLQAIKNKGTCDCVTIAAWVGGMKAYISKRVFSIRPARACSWRKEQQRRVCARSISTMHLSLEALLLLTA